MSTNNSGIITPDNDEDEIVVVNRPGHRETLVKRPEVEYGPNWDDVTGAGLAGIDALAGARADASIREWDHKNCKMLALLRKLRGGKSSN